ncbi:MAG: SpoIIE family protein phosphatase [Leptospiraceae bacterium]|nr:SpoIIE family protein phosphatase [Leptospiraceae bacterium]
MQQLILINFFSVSSFIATVFYLLVSLFVFLGIKDKSRATVMLGLGFLFSGLLALSFVPAYSINHPLMAFHRWGTVPMALMAYPFYAQIILHFPRTNFPRSARALLIVQVIAAIVLSGIFYYGTFSAHRIYHFNGHFWDFEAPALTRLVGLMILLNLVAIIVAGAAQMKASAGSRGLVGIVTAIFVLSFAVTAVTNVLSRDGLMPRDLHQTFLVLMSSVGLFAILIFYLNHTTDETTFMVKIVGVSLVTFMVVLVFICYFTLEAQEKAYDDVHRQEAARLTMDQDYSPSDLEYLVVYDLEEKGFRHLRASETAQTVTFRPLEDEFINTAMFESIAALAGEDWKQKLHALLKKSPANFAGYRALLEDRANRAGSATELLGLMTQATRGIAYQRKKIQALPEQDFRHQLQERIRTFPDELAPFQEAIRRRLEMSSDLQGAEEKADILRMFTPFHRDGTRLYRRGEGTGQFVAFMYGDLREGLVYEAGFSYNEYRQHIHRMGLRLALIFVAIVFVVVVGFRFFFLGTLVRPLDRLLEGVREVNEGNLSVEIPVATPDEIGFLTRSFNGMVQSIRTGRHKLQEYADELEDKVKARTAELQDTLNKVQELKEQQDGDYFLTSLLIKPLTGNWSRSETVDVDYLLEQKKQFSFRRWAEEIGGDFCSAHSIQLRGRPYTVFMNADAMGKSMQGAGGALVLGAVFESIMERTRMMSGLKRQSPERWIKNAFQELQGVFEAFDGSMLISMALGVVDDESGLMYYINAEHPWGVLYRDGKATFFEQEQVFRKLGVSGLEGQISIRTLQLEPEDVIVVGSDGRDDLLIGTGSAGERVFNEDETLFLKVVEQTGADLNAISNRLREIGEVTDDLSLVRVRYHRRAEGERSPDQIELSEEKRIQAIHHFRAGDNARADALLQEAIDLDPDNAAAIRLIARSHLQKKEYAKSLQFVEDYLSLRPADTDMMYLGAFLCKKLRRFMDAVDYGERVRLRQPGFVRNLVTLGEAYFGAGNRERGIKILEQALALEPDNARASRLLEKVQSVQSSSVTSAAEDLEP